MVPNNYSLTWDSYKSTICNGFSFLQQNGEFVDMTLAADGHLVKVHQVLIALASPYLKELITSVPAQHPVLFLNNVPHATLGLLLEYIYTGEVLVPAKNLQSFMEAAKALHIRGLEAISSNYNSNVKTQIPADSATVTQVQRGIPLDINSVQTTYELPTAARKVSVRQEPQITNIISVKNETQNACTDKEEFQSYTDSVMDTAGDMDTDDESRTLDDIQLTNMPGTDKDNQNLGKSDDDNRIDGVPDPNQADVQEKVSSNNLQFTVSIRGSLQVILNRYMYNLQSTALNTSVRRWRCIDYRNKKCPATLVTKGNVVMNRACLHSHSFHDKKILTKMEKNAVYSALDEVEGYKEKERRKSVEEEWPIDAPSFLPLDNSSDMNENSNSKSNSS